MITGGAEVKHEPGFMRDIRWTFGLTKY